MKILLVLIVSMCLGSCIGNRIAVFQPPIEKAVETTVTTPVNADLSDTYCSELQEGLDRLFNLVSVTTTPSELKEPTSLPASSVPSCPIFTLPSLESSPKLSRITIEKDNDPVELANVIDVLLSHIEKLERTSANNRVILQRSYNEYRKKCP